MDKIRVFPVSTGINRENIKHHQWTIGVPRKYGDKPNPFLLNNLFNQCSP
ncbi:hypothetical protein XNA1_3980003 [Xenorhabdus nematophila str. Anatoliense]|nr:hypothetical protein XNA1_3980003 [Xenorhabdus nematophila str. Anatoliense]